jgi:hypothetical protein
VREKTEISAAAPKEQAVSTARPRRSARAARATSPVASTHELRTITARVRTTNPEERM